MDENTDRLRTLLTATYRSLSKAEELLLRGLSDDDLSQSELRVLESVAELQDAGATVTEIARDLEITPPSVTMVVKRLEKKGYVTKARSGEDARRVLIVLTRKGSRADVARRYYQRKIVRGITRELTETEKDALLHAVAKINDFIRAGIDGYAAGKD